MKFIRPGAGYSGPVALVVRVICPNCSHAFTPAVGGPPACPKCHYVLAGAMPTMSAGPVFAPAGTLSAPGLAPPPAAPAYAPRPRTSGMSVAALVLGIVGLPLFFMVIPSLLAAIFGIVGAVQTRTGVQKGQGMAIAGLVMGAVSLFVAVFVFNIVPWDEF